MKSTPDDTLGLLSMHFLSSLALVVVESCCSQSALSLFFLCLVIFPVSCELCYFHYRPLTVYPGVLMSFSE
jgi:hypothetical protein